MSFVFGIRENNGIIRKSGFWQIRLINSIQGCRYFSQLDCKSGFWQIRLDEDSKPWTAFSCPCGLYE